MKNSAEISDIRKYDKDSLMASGTKNFQHRRIYRYNFIDKVSRQTNLRKNSDCQKSDYEKINIDLLTQNIFDVRLTK